MILLTYMLMMITATFALYLASTPIALGINILTMSLLLSATIATSMSSWFAFLVFLIYVGGMLVMFAYFLALTPNQQMSYVNSFMYAIMSIVIITTTVTTTNINTPMFSKFYHGNTLLYLANNAPMLIMLALILLLTMIIVVKLTMHTKGPLRPFN